MPSAILNLPGFTTNTLPATDDGSTGAVPIGFNDPINFFGVTRSSVFVNNNGNITFTSDFRESDPSPLTNTAEEIIAPFFADVITRVTGSGVVTYGNDTVDGHNAFGVDYINVEYFRHNVTADKLNSFQVILIDRSDTGPGNYDIEFNYDKIQWESGDTGGASGGLGGHSARAGFANGTSAPGTFFELPGSAVPGSFLDSNLTTGLIHNSLGSPVLGRYIFQAREGQISLKPNFDSLSGPTITQGTPQTTLSGHIIAGSQVPLGDVSITLNGVTQTAQIDASGHFSSVFETSALTASGSPYPITYSYAGGASGTVLLGSVTDSSQSVTVPPVPTVLAVPPVPTVLALQRFGFRAQPTTLVLSFSTALNPTRAEDLSNYQLDLLGLRGRPVRAIRLRSAMYDPSTDAVTLKPTVRLPLRDHYRLTVIGTAPNGVSSAKRVLLDGNGDGLPGGNFVRKFGSNALAGSSNVAHNKSRYHWAGRNPFGGLQIAAIDALAAKGELTTRAVKVRFHHR